MSVDDATPSAFDIGIDPPIQRNHMKCCIDLDGVVADFMSHVANWHSKPNLQEWDMYKKWSMNVEEFWRPLDYDFWFTIPVTDEANELLKIVESHFEDICFLTSPCLTKGCLQGKYDWVKKHFPKYERKLLIGACKEFCASSETVLIDDFDYNIKKFTEAGGLGITFPRPWNINRELEPLTYIKERCYEISH
jgi:5'(3')-deoxyribonucleotidase